jgi:hypothetical protein
MTSKEMRRCVEAMTRLAKAHPAVVPLYAEKWIQATEFSGTMAQQVRDQIESAARRERAGMTSRAQ